jgi:hypothetical protein
MVYVLVAVLVRCILHWYVILEMGSCRHGAGTYVAMVMVLVSMVLVAMILVLVMVLIFVAMVLVLVAMVLIFVAMVLILVAMVLVFVAMVLVLVFVARECVCYLVSVLLFYRILVLL